MKKRLLLSLLAIFLAGLGFGGVSMADDVAKIGEVGYATLEAAIAAVPTDGTETTITLMEDVTATNTLAINGNRNIILDLNSNTLNNTYFMYVLNGKLVIENGNFNGDAIRVYGSEDSAVASKYSYLKVEENVTIDTDGYAIIVTNNTTNAAYGVTLDIYGTLADNIRVMGNIYEGNSTINMYGTINSSDVGIAQNGYSIVNIYDGTSITAAETALEIRAGEMHINGGTFTSNGNPASVVGNGNGTTTVGAAIAISQHTTNLPINVEVVGGEFNGVNSLIITNPEGNDIYAEGHKVEVAVNGGTFNGAVVSENQKEGAEPIIHFIAGGTFSENPNTDYLVDGAVINPVASIGSTNYATLASAVAGASDGDTIIVLKDLDQTEQVTITKSITLDLNGKTLSNTTDIWDITPGSWSLISVQGEGVEVTITGNGVLQAKENDEYAVDLRDGAKVTIENGTYNGNISAVYVHDGELTINGGIFKIQQLDNIKPYAFTLNCLDANYANGTCKISVKGGKFNNFDPAANAAESNDDTTNFLAEGYQSTVEGDNYTVSAIDYTITISDAISNGTVTASKTTANVGDQITLTATPASNYNFTSWAVKDSDNNDITVTNNIFTMPAKNVTVSAIFTKKFSGGGSSSSSSSSNNNSSNNTPAEESTENTGTVAPTVDPQGVAANGYTNEMNEAYEFAYANGITTMKSIDEAEMLDGLTRIAMAKMLSQYAINVLGKSPADVVVPNFIDVSADLDAEYDNGVTLAYKLGIMGINMPGNKFLPFEYVTRSQFGTALSRLLFGIEDGENAYYTTHLAKLKEAGIITNDDPTLEELRGYVMLMLMRSSKGSNTVSTSTEPAVSNENTNTSAHEVANEPKEEQEVEAYFTEAYRKGQIYGRIGDLQRLLKSLGYYNGDINNTFDNNTIDAVFDFQIAMGILPADDKSSARGNVGPKTRDVLNQKWAEFNK